MSATLVTTLSDRKEEILQEARALFSARGYASASMRELADCLNIKPASLYSNFKSKEVMLWEIALRCAQAFFDAVKPKAESSLNSLDRLSTMVDAHLDVIIENQDVSAIFFEEWKHLEEPHLTEFKSLRDEYENLFIEVLNEGMGTDTFKTLPPRFITHTLLASVNWVSKWYKPEGEMSVEDVKKTLKNLLLGGLLI